MGSTTAYVDRSRIARMREREEQRFGGERPGSRQLAQKAGSSVLGGLTMNFMTKWPGGFPPYIADATGARLWDGDGNKYVGATRDHRRSAACAAATRVIGTL